MSSTSSRSLSDAAGLKFHPESGAGLPRPKRRKIDVACELCRLRKSKCDGAYPCEPCLRRKTGGGACTYLDGRSRQTHTQAQLAGPRQRLEHADSVVEQFNNPLVDANYLLNVRLQMAAMLNSKSIDSGSPTFRQRVLTSATGRTRALASTSVRLLVSGTNQSYHAPLHLRGCPGHTFPGLPVLTCTNKVSHRPRMIHLRIRMAWATLTPGHSKLASWVRRAQRALCGLYLRLLMERPHPYMIS